jgi:hypothetical protein
VNEHRTPVRRIKLPASERPDTLYEYWVTGRDEFPVDMLRYDAAWPIEGDVNGREARSVKLRSYRSPTILRWNSFLWWVLPPGVDPRIER